MQLAACLRQRKNTINKKVLSMQNKLNNKAEDNLPNTTAPNQPKLGRAKTQTDSLFQALPKSSLKELHRTNLRLQDSHQREQRFLRALIALLFSSALSIGLVFLVLALIFSQVALWMLTALCTICIPIYGSIYWLSRRPNLVRVGSWLIMIYLTLLLILAAYLFGPAQPIAATFILPIMLSLFLLPKLATLVFSLLGVICTLLVNLVDYQPPFLLPEDDSNKLGVVVRLLIWGIAILLPSLIGILLSHQLSQLKQVNQLAIEQAQRLEESLLNINIKRQFGQSVSQRIASVTAELQAVANQQTSGNAQQVLALNEVINFLSELAATASVIETKTEIVNTVSVEVLDLSENVQQTTLAVAETGKQGLLAVERTIENNQSVSQLYTSLKAILEALRQRSNKINVVIAQLKNLSDETHLLALNASIEAAGAGVYGERFEVIAHEVKSLADRSLLASKNAEENLLEIEAYVEQAVDMSEKVQVQTRQAVSVAAEAGEVINTLTLVIGQNTTEAGKIWLAATNMRGQMQEIKVVASQQRSGTGQAVETLRELGAVAEQNASGSMQVNNTSHDLEELSEELSLVLAA
jgi:methyl-accepting chemotaxis protein